MTFSCRAIVSTACAALALGLAPKAPAQEPPAGLDGYLRREASMERFDFEGPTAVGPESHALPAGWLKYVDAPAGAPRHGDFPAYFEVDHVDDPALARHEPGRPPESERKCVRIRLSGGRMESGRLVAGQAAVYREVPRPIDRAFAYEVRGHVRAVIDGQGRLERPDERRTSARLRLEWLDDSGRNLPSPSGGRLFTEGEEASFAPGDSGWAELPELRVNDVPEGASQVRLWAAVRSTDRDAAVLFDDLAILRGPRAVLTTGRKGNLYAASDPVEVTVEFKGLPVSPEILGYRRVLRATDLSGRALPADESRFGPSAVAEHRYVESVRFALDGFGPFELRTELYKTESSGEQLVALRQERIGRLRPYRPQQAAGEIYGVEIAPASARFGEAEARAFDMLGLLLARVRLWDRSLKLEGGGGGQESWRALDQFLGRFGRRGGRLVGVLGEFPDELASKLSRRSEGMAGALRESPREFEAWLAATVGRFQFYVDSWQLGADRDRSFASAPDVEAVVAPVRRFLQARAELRKISIPWPLGQAAATPEAQSVDACSVFVPAEVEPEKMSALLSGARGGARRPLWLLIETQPLQSERGGSRAEVEMDQAVDLSKKLVLARCSGAERILVAGFEDPEHGLVAGGRPTAAYYALSTCAKLLTAADYLGEVDVAPGVEGHLFAEPGGMGLVAAWRSGGRRAAAAPESVPPMYLGEPRRVRALDVFGNVSEVETTQSMGSLMQRPRISGGVVFLTGLDLPLMRTRRSTRFEEDGTIQSRFSSQRVSLRVSNHFDSPSEIRITPLFPRGWKTEPATARVTLAPGEEVAVPLNVRPAFGETLGPKDVLLELRFHDREPIRLARPIVLASEMELVPDLTRHPDGRLELRLEAVWRAPADSEKNSIDLAVSVDIPGRPRKRGFILRLAPGGRRGLPVPIMLDPVGSDETPIRVGAVERGGDRFVNIESTVGELLGGSAGSAAGE